MSCLIDTNVLVDALTGHVDGSVLLRIDEVIADRASYSVITRMELLGWSGHTVDSRGATQALLEQLTEVNLTPTIIGVVIDIRSAIAIKLPDAIIAASALTENLPLMTRNIKDFKRITGLELIDPYAV